MKRISVLLALIISGTLLIAQSNFHDFKVEDIDGKEFDMSQFEGSKVMVVNTASKCGLTPQYEELQKLYKTYSNKGFVIIAFPANNFLKQEPGSNAEIKTFCDQEYGVTFPVMSKISVKGKDMHPIYAWLTSKEKNNKESSDVSWNFQKYLIDEEGQLFRHFSPKTKPFDPEIIKWIEN